MATAVKKTTAPSKLRKTATKKEKAPQEAKSAMPSREEIEQLARRYWAASGYREGFAEQDWFRAEQELLQRA
jgi:hypothetical protein